MLIENLKYRKKKMLPSRPQGCDSDGKFFGHFFIFAIERWCLFP